MDFWFLKGPNFAVLPRNPDFLFLGGFFTTPKIRFLLMLDLLDPRSDKSNSIHCSIIQQNPTFHRVPPWTPWVRTWFFVVFYFSCGFLPFFFDFFLDNCYSTNQYLIWFRDLSNTISNLGQLSPFNRPKHSPLPGTIHRLPCSAPTRVHFRHRERRFRWLFMATRHLAQNHLLPPLFGQCLFA